MEKLKIVVIVSADLSDIYFANQLIKHLPVSGVFVETRSQKLSDKKHINEAMKLMLKPAAFISKVCEVIMHRKYQRKALNILKWGFGSDSESILEKDGCKVVHVNGMNVNAREYADQIRFLKPDVIAVCGASILKEPILGIPTKGTLNLHGGLSQRYRGEWPTLWAVYNEEPEYVGCTVHFVNPGIDDGDIVFQERCPINKDDNQESLYVKVVKLGTNAMIEAIKNIDTVRRYPLTQKGALYLRKNVTPKVIAETWNKVKKGTIRRYVQNPKEVELIGVRVCNKRELAVCPVKLA